MSWKKIDWNRNFRFDFTLILVIFDLKIAIPIDFFQQIDLASRFQIDFCGKIRFGFRFGIRFFVHLDFTIWDSISYISKIRFDDSIEIDFDRFDYRPVKWTPLVAGKKRANLCKNGSFDLPQVNEGIFLLVSLKNFCKDLRQKVSGEKGDISSNRRSSATFFAASVYFQSHSLQTIDGARTVNISRKKYFFLFF